MAVKGLIGNKAFHQTAAECQSKQSFPSDCSRVPIKTKPTGVKEGTAEGER